MNKKYEIKEDSQQFLNEHVASYKTNSEIVEALWTLIIQQPENVQHSLAERFLNLRASSSDYKVYTLEELNSRIDEAELQMQTGEVVSGEEVHNNMRKYINSISL